MLPAVIDAVAPAFTLITALCDAEHPLLFVTEYVIVAVPAEIPVTIPFASTIATLLSLDDHVPPVVADANCVVPFAHTFVAPVIAATIGNGLTVTFVSTDCVQLFAEYVYVIVAVPEATLETTPFASTVATLMLFVDHVPPASVLTRVVVVPRQNVVVPVEATGLAKGVNVINAVSALEPHEFNAV